MKKQYMSMQEQLAARRAAEAGQADPRRRRDRPGRSGSAGKFSRFGQSAGKFPRFRQSATGRPAPDKTKRRSEKTEAGRAGTFSEQELFINRRIRRVVFAVIALGVMIMVGGFIAELQDPHEGGQDTRHSSEPTQQTVQTTSGSPRETRHYDVTNEFHRGTMLAEIMNYAAEHTEAADTDKVFGDPYQRIYPIMEDAAEGNDWFVYEGRLYVSKYYFPGYDMDQTIEDWKTVTESVQEALKGSEVEYIPFIVIYQQNKTYDLRLVMIDGEPIYIDV